MCGDVWVHLTSWLLFLKYTYSLIQRNKIYLSQVLKKIELYIRYNRAKEKIKRSKMFFFYLKTVVISIFFFGEKHDLLIIFCDILLADA